MKVQFTQLSRVFNAYKDEFESATLKTLNSGWYIMGEELTKFEKNFAGYQNMRHCVGLNSGLDALILAFRALGIGQGDEVIVPANTYIASVIGVIENGATPIFVEPNDYFLLDETKIEKVITERTKAILPVHLYGQTCNMDAIMDIANKYNLSVVEDCAQSHGSTFKNKKSGTQGTISCFSFYPTKPLGAFGDSGAICTNDEKVAEKVRMMRNYGSKVKYHNEIKGVNSRLDEMQASILNVGLSHLDEMNMARHKIGMRYLTEIKNSKIELPKLCYEVYPVFHIFPILSAERDAFQLFLEDNGVNTQIHYPIPPHLADCYKELGYKVGDFPKTEDYAKSLLSLPIYFGLTDDEISHVIKTVNAF